MEKRLKAVTGMLDTRLTYAAKPMRNVKKEMVAEANYALIEKNNLLLLQRMHAVSAAGGGESARQAPFARPPHSLRALPPPTAVAPRRSCTARRHSTR